MIYAIAYVLSIVGANYAFTVLPAVPLPGGGILPAATFAVGFTFVLRDLAQRSLGHGVLLAMVVASGISYLMADPVVVTASVAAFVVAELADYVVYTLKGGTLHSRILLSSVVSTPLDSAVFLALLPFPGTFNLMAVLTMTGAKLTVALVWWFILRRRYEYVPA